MTGPPAAPTGTATRPRLGRAERRAAIVAGASDAFASGGFAATSMADIAAATGVSHLIVYRHFESKSTLYEAVLDHALEVIAGAVADPASIGTYGPTTATLLGAARCDPAAFQVLFRHASREPDFAAWPQRARRLLVEVTSTALAPHVTPALRRWAARATVAYLVESVLVWLEDGDPRYEERFAAATDAALRAGVKCWAKAS